MTPDFNAITKRELPVPDEKNVLEYVNNILPYETYEEYCKIILDNYATNIKLKQNLPIQTDYWMGLSDGEKYLTISKSDYDHDSVIEKSTILFYETSLISHVLPSLCVVSYYAEVYGKSGKSHKCIIILFHCPEGVLVNAYTWDDDENPEFLYVDINNVDYSNDEDRFITYITNVIVSSLSVKILPTMETHIKYLQQQGYTINKNYGLDTYDLDVKYLSLVSYINELK